MPLSENEQIQRFNDDFLSLIHRHAQTSNRPPFCIVADLLNRSAFTMAHVDKHLTRQFLGVLMAYIENPESAEFLKEQLSILDKCVHKIASNQLAKCEPMGHA